VELIAVFAGTRLLLLGQQIDTEEAICSGAHCCVCWDKIATSGTADRY